MNTSAIEQFHSSVAVLPAESMDVPAGGLARFLQQNLRIIVDHMYYAVCIRQNEFRRNFSRHNTPTQVSWMFYFIGMLLYSVGFDGNDLPDIHGVNVFGLAVSQAEFFLKECTETVVLFCASKQAIFLDYEEYDPHRTVEVIFVSRQPPRNFKRIPVNDNPILDLLTKTDAQQVVEVTLLTLSHVNGVLLVKTDSDGKLPGSATREKLDNVMECYICPSVYLLDCALRPVNTGWLRRHKLTMLELILVHDAISNIMGFLMFELGHNQNVASQFRLLNDGGHLPGDILIGDQLNVPQAYVVFLLRGQRPFTYLPIQTY
ncbi:hypothetical protein B0H16DRAFT_1463836 [Mycena metata]|uniref:Uncharacterized protein n=1 Tax=Mycena metata TaxID=1033252 RepID=A0AAD7IHE5_9AGAR|nr:hypothetical protein B0H16DRAFT_1463836 [Mycena metata]